jgi:hypothetical protein
MKSRSIMNMKQINIRKRKKTQRQTMFLTFSKMRKHIKIFQTNRILYTISLFQHFKIMSLPIETKGSNQNLASLEFKKSKINLYVKNDFKKQLGTSLSLNFQLFMVFKILYYYSIVL